jgi:CRISPR-associated protein Cmr2
VSRQVFRFHLGPVQGFIAEARRTRDLWAGSFLLSWLAAHAMVAVRKQNFTIDFPMVEKDGQVIDRLVHAIENDGDGAPLLATVPNQFMASGDVEPDPQKVTKAVQTAWRQVADAVYGHFVQPHIVKGNGTEQIWESQIAGFWEMYWVLGPAEGGGKEGAWLDQRKNWRSWRMPNQGGEHCTLMGEWQEISGYSRLHQLDEHKKFWAAMQEGPADNRGEDNRLDLRDGERLCAVALVKRLFPRLPESKLKQAIGWVPGGDATGIRYWPSTGHVAAARWLADIERKSRDVLEQCDALARHIDDQHSARHFGEQHPRVACVQRTRWFAQNTTHHFASLDANFLRADDLANARSLPLYDRCGNALDDEKRLDPTTKMVPERMALLDRHRAILTAVKRHNEAAQGEDDKIKFDEPPPYYAMLLMDGDRVGKLLDGAQDSKVSEALSDFTGKVAEHFGLTGEPAKFDGVLIYAGGDDVLALTAVEDAIPAAARLAKNYRDAFAKYNIKTKEGGDPDISAAIVFADHHEPFRDVSREAHRLLERVAKDGNNRASLAIGVQKPSGQAAEWVGKWQLADGTDPPPDLMLKLAMGRTYSNRFAYNLRARYIAPAMGKFRDIGFTNADIERIFRHELGKSRAAEGTRGGDPPIAEMLVLSRPRSRQTYDSALDAPVPGLDEAGLLVVRFLDQYGIW